MTTPCLLLPLRPLDEARADAADKAWALAGAKALEFAQHNPAPSCRWSMQHLGSRYGNFCHMCGQTMDPPNPTWRRRKTAEVVDFPLTEADVKFAGSRL